MVKIYDYTTFSESETLELGFRLGKILRPGDIVCLNGDLGAGKTHFTMGIGKALGVVEYITSPTFTIVNEYSGRIDLLHFDAYRLEGPEELFEIGFDEYLLRDAVFVIEWASRIEDALPRGCINVGMKYVREDVREIRIYLDESRGCI
ncbi:MAG: tRNA (adenosine(37)-N6)-threonylcarbamoyltransferase complex ATPase subunit type 1 TsaE [Clostridiales bacterium]|jgi:tRNA threonylcarbamoyladenosine biosynthesis protein TsaE|nr:tRNA (adenosine(37)-N6)-threonylcarbamoyltransferase complex ATPase subunit type 1 TsaE [Clostridiales bacterium]